MCCLFVLLMEKSGPITGTNPFNQDWKGAVTPKATPPPPTWSTRDSANSLAAAFSNLKQRSQKGTCGKPAVPAGLATSAMPNGHRTETSMCGDARAFCYPPWPSSRPLRRMETMPAALKSLIAPVGAHLRLGDLS